MADVIGALAAERYMSLTTRRQDGTLASAPVWVVSDDGVRLLVWTGAATWKVRRIRRDARVFVAACDYRGHERSPRFPAHARVLGPVAARVVDPLFRRKYGWQRRLLELRARLSRPSTSSVYLEIVPIRAAGASGRVAEPARRPGTGR